MQTNITLLFFTLLSTLLIVVTLLLKAKPLYLTKVERERISNIQKVYHKSYLKKRIKHTPKRSIKFAKMEIDKILTEEPIIFEKGSSSLDLNNSRKNYKILAKIVDVVNNLESDSILQIETHTDKTGSKRDNLKLSQKRADILKSYIKDRSNIVFISAIGYGEEIQEKKSKIESQKKYLKINLKRIK